MPDILLDPDPPAVPSAQQALAHVDALPAGTRLAEFEVQGLLGVGGFGLVYRAYDHSLHRTVAIKEYMPAALAGRQDGIAVSIRSSADQATYQSGLKSFMAEARLLAQFDHPSLVKVYRFWEANNTAYMVMPLYSGVTLKQARSQMAAPPPEAWLRTVLWSILQALQVLHEHNTLHRDVSPDNIFLQDMGPPVLLDLGAARRAISDKSHKLTAILKVNFAPIEQYAEAEDLKQGPWTDLYALAAVVYSCLRNDPPLPATARVVRDSLPSLQSVVETVEEHFGLEYSDGFVEAITRALAVQPADRPQSVHDFVEELDLQAPSGLGKFDWRTALGAELLPALEDNSDSRSLWATLPQTVPVAAATTIAPSRWAVLRSRWARWRPRRGLVLALLLAVVLLGGALVYEELLGDTPLVAAPEPAATPAPVMAQAPVPELPASASETDPWPVDPGILAAPAAAQTASAPVPEPLATAAPKPESAPEIRRLVPKLAGKPASPASAPKVPVKPASAKPVPAKPSTPAGKVLCANANFWYRPMCIHLECKKPENYNRPICVENRRRYPDGPSPAAP